MKLIVAGATGFVGKEVIRLSLKRPDITTVIALSRTPVSPVLEDGTDVSKLRNVIIKDYGDYPDSVKNDLAGADACIWTVAITPTKSKGMDFKEVKRVCQDCPVTGLRTMHEAGANVPFRFIYMSGSAAERDPTKTPAFLPEYLLMRVSAENQLLAVAAESKGDLEVCVAKPGWITAATFTTRSVVAFVMKLALSMPSVTITECSAAMLDQVANGFEKEPLVNKDLVRIGRRVLSAPPSED
ncbi:hypothetical protein OIDMADRAFT_131398 [Oidiodendron maius Zn]|uniref:NAD(P)-binding domain-containing protein n=1 Tax=Oidiodendron maius (strain Zn) TaxID=913774 RepID=A0A0C3CCQ2_OIDMZ|nr:hypothetical protein OIDMADRAFT_131398 [Oidiodendron maius Zn]